MLDYSQSSDWIKRFNDGYQFGMAVNLHECLERRRQIIHYFNNFVWLSYGTRQMIIFSDELFLKRIVAKFATWLLIDVNK